MGVFEMVVIVVFIGCVFNVISDYLKTQRQKTSSSPKELDDAFNRIDGLEERVRVLERVVTDEKYDLNRQFNELRES